MDGPDQAKLETLFPFLKVAALVVGQTIQRSLVQDAYATVRQLPAGIAPPELIQTAWTAVGLEGRLLGVDQPTPSELPFVGWSPQQGWLLFQAQAADGRWKAQNATAQPVMVDTLTGIECLALPSLAPAAGATTPSAVKLVWQSILLRRSVFLEALLATMLLNLISLAISLYSMQVYDRVIPNQGFQTLWVLTTGVILSIIFEFSLKQVRGLTVDRVCKNIDGELSEWFFRRALAIRMDQRPASIGTMASQIKGFEMVRGIMTSTSLFVLADVPFAFFFILVIFLVGGWVAIVPLIMLPISLAAGLMFQRAINAQTKENLSQNNQKTGLLVETIDGAEQLKATGAEWKFQSRWNTLVKEIGETDLDIKRHSVLSQNMAVAIQQLGYIAIVAFGAYLVTENRLTTGGLLACSIISGRIMNPIAQLPGVMIQWAHASAALDGLDKIISLPSELDEQDQVLVPQNLTGAVRFERVRFAYGMANQLALEIGHLAINPGEKIGILGSIGSGKSTLLKLASGLYRPNEGKVFLGGVDMALLAPAIQREMIGYLPQDQRLFSGTLRDNLLLGLPDPGDETILQAARQTGLIDLIVGQPKALALPITEGGRGVSGGQRQIIGLTRMLLARPRVWLLDEPTASMDAATEGRVAAILQGVTAGGATLLVATHKAALLPVVDRLIVVQGGRIVADGPRDTVLAQLAGKAQTPTAA